jgi:nitronate monooxygenase
MRTPLCELLGIEHPVLQSGMRRLAGPDLVAEVSNAGGLGLLAGVGQVPDDLRQQIRQVRALTSRPFGVNLWLHPAITSPEDAAQVPPEVARGALEQLNGFRRRLGLPDVEAVPRMAPNPVAELFEVILEERVPVWSIGLGNPEPAWVARCHERGLKVMAMVTTVEDARAVEASGVDVIVAQGSEAGGHRSVWTQLPSGERSSVGAMALVPQVVDAVRVPVVAAGGVADGRGLLAALALGAQGVMLGTRFVATRESKAPDFWKDAVLKASGDDTTVTKVLSGLYARALRNAFTEEYAASGAPVLPGYLQATCAHELYQAALAQGRGDLYPLMAGQSAGLVRDLPGAGEVVRALVREAEEALEKLGRLGGRG